MAYHEYTSPRAEEVARAHSRGPNAAALAALRDAQRVGLSGVHTSPRYWCRVAETGAMIELKSRGVRQPRTPDHARGRVTQFSRRSRSRLMKLCASVDRNESARALMVTLTYPANWSKESTTYKRHLDSFGKRLTRQFPRASTVWKLEFQKRGAPHFHLLVWGQSFIPAATVSRWWYEIVGSGDPKHLAAGTEVRRVRSYRQAVSYAAKYLSKLETGGEDHDWVGRYWGVVGRRSLPIAIVEFRLDKAGSVRLARVLRGLSRSRRRKRKNRARLSGWTICRGDRARVLAVWAADGLTYHPSFS